jgi:hypothetical protein
MVKAWLDRGAPIDGVDPLDLAGQTALIAAIEGDHPEVVKLLARRGADLDVRDARGKSAPELARERRPHLLALLAPEDEAEPEPLPKPVREAKPDARRDPLQLHPGVR